MGKKSSMGFYYSWHRRVCRNLVSQSIKDVGSCHFSREKSLKPVHLRKLPCVVTQRGSCGDSRWSLKMTTSVCLCPASIATLRSHQPLRSAGLQLHFCERHPAGWGKLRRRLICQRSSSHSQETTVWCLSHPAWERSSVITELQELRVLESQNSLAYKTNPSVNSPQFNK